MREICADIIRYLISEGCEIVYGVTGVRVVFEYTHKLYLEKYEVFEIDKIEDINTFKITKLDGFKDTMEEYFVKYL